MLIRLEFSSALPVSRAALWQAMTAMEGINQEMRPWLTMGAPAGVRGLQDVPLTPGKPLFRSSIKLFGWLPIGYSDLTLLSLTPGEGFVEASPMTGMRDWRHERRLEDSDTGCRLLDTLVFEPRVLPTVTSAIIRAFFGHRHRRLRRRYR
ncbi:MAG: hypothetical protein V7688_05145 [Alcanivorax jadensis]|jgi:hypothetical protein|uniref:hypothetical protein n=1 Tax=Alcanivorax jadensis TaxID=64988 RepID=UPI003001F529|tara:strand:- start:115 stop:564 length:450 start_codon:yes stop_codon:yes gene_type:complete